MSIAMASKTSGIFYARTSLFKANAAITVLPYILLTISYWLFVIYKIIIN
jgi:hypothetical protein